MSGSVPNGALELNESVSLVEASAGGTLAGPNGSTITLGYDGDGNLKEGGVFDAQGRVPVHIIRPGLGRGRGRHLYEAGMLSQNAPKFSGWKMFVNHLSPEARKAQGGLPRDVRDLGGRVQESWWDSSVPADDKGHDAGSVVGMVRPVKFIRELIDDDPSLVEASISATATGVKPVIHTGSRAWMVEGINDRGSVDWVTEGGAGGRIAPLLEHAYETDRQVELALVESLDEGDLREYLRSGRVPAPEAAVPDPAEGGAVSDITPEAVQEALTASPQILIEAFTDSAEIQTFVATLVEAKMGEQKDSLEEAAQTRVDRAFTLAAFEREAHKLIRESKLPESWQEGLRKRYRIEENRPTDGLDVSDDTDDDGKVTKTALDKLREAVAADIAEEHTRLAEARPTRVRNQGGGSREISEAKDGGEEKDADGKKKKSGPQPYWAEVLSEAGFEDPEQIYAGA